MPKLTDLPGNLYQLFKDLNDRDIAEGIGKQLMDEEMPPNVFSNRLRNSGFLFVDGIYRDHTRAGAIDFKKSRGHGRMKPDAPQLNIIEGKNIHQINIQFHTPKKAGDKARVYYPWRGGKWFDYSRMIMEQVAWEMQFRFGANQAGRYFKQIAEETIKRRLG
jgi:hypothetical protein